MSSATVAEKRTLMGQLLNDMRKDMNLLDKSNQVTNFAEQEEENDFSPTLLANVDNCISAFCSFVVYRNNILIILFYFTVYSLALVLFMFINFFNVKLKITNISGLFCIPTWDKLELRIKIRTTTSYDLGDAEIKIYIRTKKTRSRTNRYQMMLV